MAMPTYVGHSAAIASATGNITPALPSGLQDGDLLIIFVETANEATNITTPTGWTVVPGLPQGTGTAGGTSATKLQGFYKRYVTGDTAPVIAGSENHKIGRMIAIRGIPDSGDPFDASSGGVKATTSTSITWNAVTTTGPDRLILLVATHQLDQTAANFGNVTNANLATITERFDEGGTAGNGGGMVVVTGEKATAAAIGTSSSTLVLTSVNAFVTLAIKSAVSPSTVQNTADGTQYNDDTPTVEATATDPNADDVVYQVQIDTRSDFKSLSGTGAGNEVVSNEQNSTGSNFGFGQFSLVRYRGMVFTPAVSGWLTKIGFARNKGTQGLRVYFDTATGGNLPTNAVGSGLYSFDITNANVIDEYGEYSLPAPIFLTAGVKYCFYLAPFTSGAYVDDYQDVRGIASGAEITNNNGTWSTENLGFQYKIYLDGIPVINKVSDTDAGFVNTVNGGDTSPFTSGQKVSFTVQAGNAIPPGLYYWRARAIDPSGSNVYGGWSATRTLVIFGVDREATKTQVATMPTTFGHVINSNTDVFTTSDLADIDTSNNVRMSELVTGGNLPLFVQRKKFVASDELLITAEFQAPEAGQTALTSNSGDVFVTVANTAVWTNPNNALVDDDVYAISNVTTNQDFGFASGAFNIPANATITAVRIKVRGHAQSVNGSTINWYVKKGGSSSGIQGTSFNTGADQAVSTTGSALWSSTHTPADWNSGAWEVRGQGDPAGIVEVDSVCVVISYTVISKKAYLDIWDDELSVWETIASSDTFVANTDTQIQGSRNANLSKYHDALFWVTTRVRLDYSMNLLVDQYIIEQQTAATPKSAPDSGSGSDSLLAAIQKSIIDYLNENSGDSTFRYPQSTAWESIAQVYNNQANFVDQNNATYAFAQHLSSTLTHYQYFVGSAFHQMNNGVLIPEDATIVGIELRVIRSATLNDANSYFEDEYVYLVRQVDDVIVSDNRATTQGGKFATSQETKIFGGPTDLWGWEKYDNAVQGRMPEDYFNDSPQIEIRYAARAKSDGVATVEGRLHEIAACVYWRTDAAEGVESITLAPVTVITDQNATVDEQVTPFVVPSDIGLNDSGVGAEALDIVAMILRTDSGTRTEAISILAQAIINDSAVGNEVLAILASIAATDSGIGAETVTGLAQISVADSGTRSEAISILAQIALSESGTAAEVLAILVSIALSDSVTGVDAILAIYQLMVSDSGLASELVDILSSLTVSDSGGISELIDLLIQIKLQEGPNDNNLHPVSLISNTNSFTPTSGPTTSDIQILSGWMKSDVDAVNSPQSQCFMAYGWLYFQLRDTVNAIHFRYDEVAARIAPALNLGSGDRSWHHVLGIYEPLGGTTNRLHLYVDGRLIGITGTLAAFPTSLKGYKLGHANGGAFSGGLKKVRFWKNPASLPTLTDVRNLMILDQVWEAPTHEFLLNEGTGTTANDTGSSGNNASLTNINFKWSVTSEPGGVGGYGTDAVSFLAQLAISDSGIGAEIIDTLVSFLISDSGTRTEVLSILAQISLSESRSATDAISILAMMLLADSGTATDAASVFSPVMLSDSGLGSEVINIVTAVALSDSAVRTEALMILVDVSLSDSVNSSEAISAVISITTQDSVAGAEAISILATMLLSDTGNTSDIISIFAQILLSENRTGTDIISIFVQFILQEVASGNDTAVALGIFNISDSGTAISEIISILAQVALSDSGTRTEAISVLAQLTLIDSGVGTEIVNALVTILQSDSGAGSDIVSILVNAIVSESGTSAEALSLLVMLTIADSGIRTEAISIMNQFLLSESGLGGDQASILAQVPIAETGLGSEVITLLKMIMAQDTGVSTEVVSVFAQFTVTDSGSALDTAFQGNTFQIADAGAAVDTLTKLGLVNIQEVGTVIEVVTVTVTLLRTDSGGATDTINVTVNFILAENGSLGGEALNIYTTLTLQDSVASQENLSVFVPFNLLDTATGTDSASIFRALQINETATGTEIVIGLGTITVTDAGFGVDLISLFIRLITELPQVIDVLSHKPTIIDVKEVAKAFAVDVKNDRIKVDIQGGNSPKIIIRDTKPKIQ